MDTAEKQEDSPHGHCIRLTITLVESLLSLVDKEEQVQTLITATVQWVLLSQSCGFGVLCW